jgi:hypothetical protein
LAANRLLQQGNPAFIIVLRPKVLDISEGGASRPSSQTRPMRAYVSLRAARINIVGSATVRHAVRCARTTIGPSCPGPCHPRPSAKGLVSLLGTRRPHNLGHGSARDTFAEIPNRHESEPALAEPEDDPEKRFWPALEIDCRKFVHRLVKRPRAATADERRRAQRDRAVSSG